MSAQRLPAPLEHYLRTGCYIGADLDLFLLAGAVIRDRLDGLRELWADTRQLLSRRKAAGDFFVEMALRVRDHRKWPAEYGPEACALHQNRSTSQGGKDDQSPTNTVHSRPPHRGFVERERLG